MPPTAKVVGGTGKIACLLLLLLFPFAEVAGVAEKYVRRQQPELFSYQELIALGEDPLPPELEKKLLALTTTPFLSNQAHYQGAEPHRPKVAQLGRCLRLVMWNIERGLQLETIKLAFTNRKQFLNRLRREGEKVNASRLLEEIEVLQTADVVVLNEVDWGLKRSGYRAVVKELGAALNMNWAYGVEFVEIDPISLGTETFSDLEDEAERKQLVNEIQVDRSQLRALHGTAVLSRYPISEARLEPFSTKGYDWYHDEKERVKPLEEGKRAAAQAVFLETISREIRRGGRTSLIVTLDVADLKQKKLTIAATHLESRTKPQNRRKQMYELLISVRDLRHPVIIAGDLNTTLSDSQPTSVKREIYRRVGSSKFWANTGIKYATGVGLLYDVVKGSVNFFKNAQDPTATDIPIIGPNPEAELFATIENFRFRDGRAIDFRGNSNRTINGTKGTLANSNQRDEKGFAVTYEVERTIGPAGRLKLDWIFVKSYLAEPRNDAGSYRFAPHYARTMEEVNYALDQRLSDHNPISVDLPFQEPGKVKRRSKEGKKGFPLWPF